MVRSEQRAAPAAAAVGGSLGTSRTAAQAAPWVAMQVARLVADRGGWLGAA